MLGEQDDQEQRGIGLQAGTDREPRGGLDWAAARVGEKAADGRRHGEQIPVLERR
jgi:hypothetical protein